MPPIRRHLSWIARLCLAIFLFGQLAVAAQACGSLQATPAMAFAAAEHACHHAGGVDSSHNRNACLMHCIQGDQNFDTQQQGVAAQAAAADALLRPVSVVVAWPQQLPRSVIVTANHSPPIPILHCRFLI